VQYQVGMQNSGCIISINHTGSAPIFDISHYGAVADYRALVPAIIEEIKNRRT
jgi:electron transfer flavoprotein alpha subunit